MTENADTLLSMTPLSWCYMGAVWLIILSLNIYCFTRIFGKKPSDNKNSE